ncbi:MAG: transposase, partial [Dehalococcoidia bacterium]|nr:transposase [Dehalococcoidia bacterium]
MHIIQAPLLSLNEFFTLDHSDRLYMVLETIDAERLLVATASGSPLGPKGYPARVLWSALIAGVVYRLPTIAELIRHLDTNPYLRLVCGIESQSGVPSAPTFSRFLSRLVKHEGLLDACFDDLAIRFEALAPGFGESVGADSSDVHAYSRGKKVGASDPDASWSAKGSKEGASKGRKGEDGKEGKGKKKAKKDLYWWFGYKVHLLVDTKYEVPIAAIVTTAKEPDTTYLRPLLDKRDQLLPKVPLKVSVNDTGYDSTENIKAITGRGALPIIPLNPGSEKAPPGITNTLGTPLCPTGLPMTYWGRDGNYLKYRCPQEATHRFCCLQDHKGTDRCSLSPYGLVVKLNMKDDPRRYVPVPRETNQFERLYKTRTVCERVNSRLKENLLL